jgi:hypothetical protein
MSRLVVLLARTRPTGRMSALWSGEDRDDDDRNFVSCAGLAPVVALAQRCGLPELVAEKLTLPSQGGANAHLKVRALVAGMVAAADSIGDVDLLRHGGMDRLFNRLPAAAKAHLQGP